MRAPVSPPGRPYKIHAENAAAVVLSNQPAARACSTERHAFAHPPDCAAVDVLLAGLEEILDSRPISDQPAFDAARDRLGLSK